MMINMIELTIAETGLPVFIRDEHISAVYSYKGRTHVQLNFVIEPVQVTQTVEEVLEHL